MSPDAGNDNQAGRASAQLAEKRCHVGADPLLSDQAVTDPVELVADVLDRPAGGGEVLELSEMEVSLVRPMDGEAQGDSILSCDDIVDPRFQSGKARLIISAPWRQVSVP